MNTSDIVYISIITAILFYNFFSSRRKEKKSKAREEYLRMKINLFQEQRDFFAKRRLLEGISHDKISYRAKQGWLDLLGFGPTEQFYGLVVTDPSSSELSLIREICYRLGCEMQVRDNVYLLPTSVTKEEKRGSPAPESLGGSKHSPAFCRAYLL